MRRGCLAKRLIAGHRIASGSQTSHMYQSEFRTKVSVSPAQSTRRAAPPRCGYGRGNERRVASKGLRRQKEGGRKIGRERGQSMRLRQSAQEICAAGAIRRVMTIVLQSTIDTMHFREDLHLDNTHQCLFHGTQLMITSNAARGEMMGAAPVNVSVRCVPVGTDECLDQICTEESLPTSVG